MTISNEEAAARMIELLVDCPLLRDANQEFWGGRDPDVPRWMSYALNLMLLDGLSTGERVLVRLVRAMWNGGGAVHVTELVAQHATSSASTCTAERPAEERRREPPSTGAQKQ